MLQHEFGLSKFAVKLWRERIDQGVEAIGRSRKNGRYSQEFKLKAVEAFLRGEGGYRSPAIEYEVRNSTQIRDWVKRYWEGGEGTLALGSPGRKKAASAAEETLEERCTRLEKEVGILKRMAALATPLSATGRSTRS